MPDCDLLQKVKRNKRRVAMAAPAIGARGASAWLEYFFEAYPIL